MGLSLEGDNGIKMDKKGIAVIGRLAEGTELLDGQTVKTKILRDELRHYFPEKKIICVDVYQYHKRFLIILWNILKAFLECEHIFVLLSRNGRTFLFPVLTGLNQIFHRRLYHDVIGGALPKEAQESPALAKQLCRFEVNWVEFQGMKEELAKAGVTNVEVLPNFKRLNIVSEKEIQQQIEEPLVFVMFSRILKEKGMEEAAEAIRNVNSRFGKQRAVLYIYGPIEPSYGEAFKQLLDDYQDCVNYMGCVSYDESVRVLSGSYMLLFPTVYRGEGMPGTIIDAFSAGLPVIATDWHFNSELVHNGITGYCYDWRKPELLTEWIVYAIEHPEVVYKMRKSCLLEATKYTPDASMKQIRKRINGTMEK